MEFFKRSPQPTLGVEWEIACVNPSTGALVRTPKECFDVDGVVPEFFTNTLELVSGVHTSSPGAVSDLRGKLEAVRPIVDKQGAKLWASGTHPLAHWQDQELSSKSHYSEIIERTQFWGMQMLIWGLHVHVGIRHEDRVWPIINALMAHYPQLLAVACSSPGWDGMDTGYASTRTMLYQQLPTAGMPYQFQSWEEWSNFQIDQQRSGVVSHIGYMHFDIRPSGKWGTIEVRIADSPTNFTELRAVVAFTHMMVVYFDRLLDEGPLPTLQPWHVSENKWRAARYGLDAEIITDRETHEAWVRDELAAWVERLTPLAREFHCEEDLKQVLVVIEQGAYERQRQLYKAGSWMDAIESAYL